MSIEHMQTVPSNAPRLSAERKGGKLRAKLSGYWTADQAPAIEDCATRLLESAKAQRNVVLDLARVERLDTIGA
jgi:phospholipid/cholesterol/gamma-HCH transport system permease protein